MHLHTRWIGFLVATALSFLGLALGAELPSPRVDFSYAFATPHRLAVARSDSSDKTLLDLQSGSLRVAWSLRQPAPPPARFVPDSVHGLDGESAHWVANPAWLEPARFSGDNLVAGCNERSGTSLNLDQP